VLRVPEVVQVDDDVVDSLDPELDLAVRIGEPGDGEKVSRGTYSPWSPSRTRERSPSSVTGR
jgi:hypothetical protein